MPLSNYIPSSRISQAGVCTSSTRPAIPYEGQIIFETDTDKTLVWNGSLWVVKDWAGLCAFSAYHASNIQICSSGTTTNSITPFTERYDIGNNFNNSTGVFTAPTTGVYRFSLILHAMGIATSTDFLYVHMNGNINIELMIVSGSTNESYNTSVQGSVSTILNNGETIGPLACGTNTAQGSAYWRGGNAFNTFTGELVKAL